MSLSQACLHKHKLSLTHRTNSRLSLEHVLKKSCILAQALYLSLSVSLKICGHGNCADPFAAGDSSWGKGAIGAWELCLRQRKPFPQRDCRVPPAHHAGCCLPRRGHRRGNWGLPTSPGSAASSTIGAFFPTCSCPPSLNNPQFVPCVSALWLRARDRFKCPGVHPISFVAWISNNR